MHRSPPICYSAFSLRGAQGVEAVEAMRDVEATFPESKSGAAMQRPTLLRLLKNFMSLTGKLGKASVLASQTGNRQQSHLTR